MFLTLPRLVCIVSLLFAFFLSGFVQAESNDVEHLVGDVDAKVLLSQFPVFQSAYQAFEPTDEDIELMKKLQGKELLVMFGTWCHDSEREVPRLLKLLHKSQVELSKQTWLAVDLNKKESSGVAKQNRLKYTPTFVLFDNGKELGRVIEKPNDSLADDLSGLVVE